MKRTFTWMVLLLLGTVGAQAQESQWQLFGEVGGGLSTTTLWRPGAQEGARTQTFSQAMGQVAVGAESDRWLAALRYRYSLPSAAQEAVPTHEVSVMLQRQWQVAPRLRLRAGVATGFALQHSQLASAADNKMYLQVAVEAGLHYRLSDHVSLTLNLGLGAGVAPADWRAMSRQLPYDARSVRVGATVAPGISIGIQPTVKRVNMPPQLVCDGDIPALVSYCD